MTNKVGNISLVVLSTIVTMLLLETGARVYKSEFRFHNFLEFNRDLLRSAYPAAFNEELGWIPKKGSHQKNIWNTRVTILNNGIRSNGNNESIENNEIILAVGDSYTFGDQVSDDETWPSRLEAISKTRVINGGVFGYGLDQSYLRLKALASKYRPNIVIFSFTPDDIRRSELYERTSVGKPYFELTGNGDIVLMKEHIVPTTSSARSLDIFRKVMGYSVLVHTLMHRAFPEYWLQGQWRSARVHSNGAEIACRIFKKLKHYAQKEKAKLYILAQYGKDLSDGDLRIVDKVTSCIDRDVLTLIDLRTSLAELKGYDVVRYESLFDGHMTLEGTRIPPMNQ